MGYSKGKTQCSVPKQYVQFTVNCACKNIFSRINRKNSTLPVNGYTFQWLLTPNLYTDVQTHVFLCQNALDTSETHI